MAKQQFTLEIAKRADRDSDPAVGEAFEIVMPPYTEVTDDGREYEVTEGRTLQFQPPGLSRFMSLSVQYELSDGPFDLVSSATALLHSCLNASDRAYVRRRFNDANDPFGLDNMSDMLEYMMETWSSRPTKKASGSSPSRAKRTSTSTPKQPSQDETSSQS